MKKITLTTFLLIIATFLIAQNSNLVVFSEGGERFYLILNGIQHNQSPETSVRVQALPEAPYKAKIVFEDKTISAIEKNLYTSKNTETTYSFKKKGDSKAGKGLKSFGNDMHQTIGSSTRYKDKEERYVIRMVSQTPIKTSENNTSTNNDITNTNSSNKTTNTTTTTTTTTNSNINTNPNGSSISMNVNINEGGSNGNTGMNVNVNDNTTYTESTTVTTSSSGNTTNTTSSDGRCDYPMNNTDYIDGKSSIESKTFADSKMTIAKQITKNNCPTAIQIRDYTKLFTFESGKLEYAKFAYDYCYDKGNYYKVNDAFEFESSIDELGEHTGN